MSQAGRPAETNICDVSWSSLANSCYSSSQHRDKIIQPRSLSLNTKPKFIASLNRESIGNLSLKTAINKGRAASSSPKVQLRVARPEFLRLEQKQLPTFNRPKRLLLRKANTLTESEGPPIHLGDAGFKQLSDSPPESIIPEQRIPSKGFFQLSKKPRRVSGVKTLTPFTQQEAWNAVTKTDHQTVVRTTKQPFVFRGSNNEVDPKKSYSRLQDAFQLLMNEEIDGYVQLDLGNSNIGASPPEKYICTLNLDFQVSRQKPRFDCKNFTSTQSLSTKSILVKNRFSKESNSQHGPVSPKKKVEFAKNKMVLFFDTES